MGLTAVLLVTTASPSDVHGERSASFLPLAELIDGMRANGTPIVYSSRLVRSDMIVPSGIEPTRAGLGRALAAHGLALEQGPGGVLMVIASSRPTPARAPKPDASGLSSGPTGIPPSLSVHETIDVVRDRLRPSLIPGIALTDSDLAERPVSGEPSMLASHAPGVVSDRIDVGGSERGKQARLAAPATTLSNNAYFIDGVETTDMVTGGRSTLFFDLDQIDTVEITTGGADVATATAGVAVRMITKRGGSTPRGSIKTSLTRPGASHLADNERANRLATGNRVDRIQEGNLEWGGPLVAERLFGWAALSVDHVDATVPGGAADDTELSYGVLKLNAQPTRHDSIVASAVGSDKRKGSRGVGINRSVEASWRQETPSAAVKLEHNHLFSGRGTLTAQVSRLQSDFSLTGHSGEGDGAAESFMGPDGVWRGNNASGSSERRADRFEVSGDAFFRQGTTDHALRFGGTYRRFETADDFAWPGERRAIRIACEALGICPEDHPNAPFLTGDLIAFNRRDLTSAALDHQALWIRDQIAFPRSTLSIGLRLDDQKGRVLGGSVDANPLFPGLLPAASTDGVDGGFRWTTVSPRLAFARTLGESQKSVLRFSFARFAGQLANQHILRLDPLHDTSATFLFTDLDGDNDWQTSEPIQLVGTFGVNRLDPLAFGSPNRTDPGLEPELTDELIAGVEHELGARWSMNAGLTWRRVHGIHQERPLVLDASGTIRPVIRDDFVPAPSTDVGLPDNTLRTREVFELSPALLFTGGTLLENGDRERRYLGGTLSLVRRLDRRYRVRAHAHYGRADWKVPASFQAVSDPTDLVGSADNDGDLFAEPTTGDFGTPIFLQSTWSLHIDGLVRIAPDKRWGFSIAGNLFAREGSPIPFFADAFTSDGINRDIQVTQTIDEFRHPDVALLDLRLSKPLPFRGTLSASLSLDVFNALDRRAVLETHTRTTGPLAGIAERTLPPRTFRLGFRLAWH